MRSASESIVNIGRNDEQKHLKVRTVFNIPSLGERTNFVLQRPSVYHQQTYGYMLKIEMK